MKKLVTILLCTAAAAVATGNGSIVSSFLSPCTNGLYDIDYRQGYLYHADGGTNNLIWVTTTTGSVVSTVRITPDAAAVGVDRTDNEFWTCRGGLKLVHRHTTGGSLLASFSTSFSPQGITYGGGYLWCAGGSAVYKLTTTGSVVSSFPAPGNTARGICWDSPYLWTSDDFVGGAVYQVTTSGSVIRSIGRPSERPRGVAWDGTYVWYADYVSNHVYAMTVAVTLVEPASLGRVKAVFR